MKVERKKIRPLKNYFVPKRQNYNETDFNVFLFEDNTGLKRTYNIIVSNENNKQDSINDKNKIISIFSCENQNEVKTFIQSIGVAAKELSKLNRPYLDYDFIDLIKEKIGSLSINSWVNKNATRFVSQEEKLVVQKQQQERKEKFKNMSQSDKDILSLKPIVLLNALDKMGVIKIISTGENGDELKHKIKFNDSIKHGSKEFNISVAKYEMLTGQKSNLFKDFGNEHHSNTGSGSIGLINHLGIYGLYNNYASFDKTNKEEMIELGKKYLTDNVIPFVPKESFVFSESTASKLYLSKTNTLPIIKKDYKKKMDTFKEFLEYRGLSKELISKLSDQNVLFSGDVYVSRIIRNFNSKKQKFDTNYSYLNSTFVSLRNSNKELESGERFNIVKNLYPKNGEKPFKYDKLNVATLDGKYFGMGEMKNPEFAVIHEAAIDAMSSYELFKESNKIDPNSIFYISTQGTSHMKGFFSKNLGFYVETNSSWSPNKKNNGSRIINVKYETINKNLTPEIIAEYKEQLKDKKLVLVTDNNEKLTHQQKELNKLKINLLKNEIGLNVVFDNIKSLKNMDLMKYDVDNDLVCTYESLDSICQDLKLDFVQNNKTNKLELKSFWQKESTWGFNEKYKGALKNRIKKFFGTDHLVYALDNDYAALPYLIYFAELERNADIKVSYMIPDDLKYEDLSLTKGISLKMMLDKFKKLCKENKYEEAYSSIIEYSSQKPNTDNNDVLKHYQSLKAKNPSAASKYLEENILGKIDLSDLNLSKKKNLKPKP